MSLELGHDEFNVARHFWHVESQVVDVAHFTTCFRHAVIWQLRYSSHALVLETHFVSSMNVVWLIS